MVSWLARLLALWLLTGTALTLAAPQGTTLEPPKGETILVVSGKISVTNGKGVASFDSDMLDRLPQHEIVTHTPWHAGTKAYRGPLLRDLMALLGAEGSTLLVVALNEYIAHIPMSDLQQYDVILARRIDGQLLRVRDRGPTFIMYPFDLQPSLKTDNHYNRCVWQVKSIHVY